MSQIPQHRLQAIKDALAARSPGWSTNFDGNRIRFQHENGAAFASGVPRSDTGIPQLVAQAVRLARRRAPASGQGAEEPSTAA